MTLLLKHIDVATFDVNGGGLFCVTGAFVGHPIKMFLRNPGDAGAASIPIYSGIAGQGYTINPLGPTARGIFPAVPAGAPAWALSAHCEATGEDATLPTKILCRVPFLSAATYGLRSLYSPIWATGPRDVAQEPFPWAP